MHCCSVRNQSINQSINQLSGIMIYTSAMMKGDDGRGQILRVETLMKQKHLSSCCCCFSFLGSFWRRTITTESSSTKSSLPLKEKAEESIAAAATDKTPGKQQQQQQKVVPWLMLSKVDRHEKSRSFFSLDEKQVHEIKFTNAANLSWCSGSSDGWLVMSHRTQGNFLYNPITQQQINLPPHHIISLIRPKLDQRLRNLYERNRMYFMDKAIVSSVPTITNSSSSSSLSSSSSDHDNNLVVAVIYERSCKNGFPGIGFCRPGDNEWCNVPFHDYGDHFFVHRGKENMVPLKGNPEVASVEGKGGVEDNNGEEEEEEEDDHVEEYELPEVDEDNNSEEEEEEEEDESNDEAYKFASDIIFYKGAFYVVTGRTTKLGIINISSSSGNNNKLKGTVKWPDIQPLKLKKSEKDILNNYYLVESCGELLMVIRIRRERKNRKALGILKTKKFLVFKLDETGDTLKWVRMESLGDQILFLGCNHSKSVSVSDMPGGYRGNCIYFTDDDRWLFMGGYAGPVCFRDIGVFFLEDEKIEPIFPKDDSPSKYYRKYCSNRKYTPTFITPNPYPSSYMRAVTRDNKN